MDARKANDRIADKAVRLRFVSRVPMLCECSATPCRAIVMISIADYRAIRETEGASLIAPGHAASGTHLQAETGAYDVRQDNDTGDGRDDELRSA